MQLKRILFGSMMSLLACIPSLSFAVSPSGFQVAQVLTVAAAFKSYTEFLRAMKSTGSATEYDVREVTDVLIPIGVAFDRAMPAPRIQGDKIFFGKYFVRVRADGQWASQDGKLLKNSSDASFANNVAANLKVMRSELPKHVSIQNLLMSSAWAIDTDLSPEAQAGQMGWAALVVAGKTALAGSQFIATCGTANWVGTLADVLSLTKLAKENFFDRGQVVCVSGTYRQYAPEEFYSALESMIKSSPNIRQELNTMIGEGDFDGPSTLMEGVSAKCIEVVKSSLRSLPDSYRPVLAAVAGDNLKTAKLFSPEVAPSFLKDTFKSEKIPPCTKDTAAVVKHELERTPKGALDGMMDVAKKLLTFGPPSLPKTTTPGTR